MNNRKNKEERKDISDSDLQDKYVYIRLRPTR